MKVSFATFPSTWWLMLRNSTISAHGEGKPLPQPLALNGQEGNKGAFVILLCSFAERYHTNWTQTVALWASRAKRNWLATSALFICFLRMFQVHPG
jgi:hypothetical protein